jgi:hypothetical protein
MTKRSRLTLIICAFILVVPLNASCICHVKRQAAQITARSLTLQAGADPILKRWFQAECGCSPLLSSFTLPTTASVGSIQFKYCTLAAAPSVTCTTPAGLSTTSATLGSESGLTGFSMVNTTNGSPYLNAHRGKRHWSCNLPAWMV